MGRINRNRKEEVDSVTENVLRGQSVISGSANGRLVVSREPLSFWGGYDLESGEIIDRQHHLSGKVGVQYHNGSSIRSYAEGQCSPGNNNFGCGFILGFGFGRC